MLTEGPSKKASVIFSALKIEDKGSTEPCLGEYHGIPIVGCGISIIALLLVVVVPGIGTGSPVVDFAG